MAFCSISCQSNEASKSYASYKLSNNTTMQSPSVRSSGKPLFTYQMSYHRRPSLSYSSSTTTTTTTSTNARKQQQHQQKTLNKHLSSSLSNVNNHNRPPFFLMQSLSTSSSFSSSLSDVSVFSTSCSCEDKATNICPPYHITRTTHNIAS